MFKTSYISFVLSYRVIFLMLLLTRYKKSWGILQLLQKTYLFIVPLLSKSITTINQLLLSNNNEKSPKHLDTLFLTVVYLFAKMISSGIEPRRGRRNRSGFSDKFNKLVSCLFVVYFVLYVGLKMGFVIKIFREFVV